MSKAQKEKAYENIPSFTPSFYFSVVPINSETLLDRHCSPLNKMAKANV
jgi:hypothetical protein